MSTIGRLNETDLHEQLKHLLAGDDGLTEQDLDGFVVDVVRGDELIEIQTRGLLKLRRKLQALCDRHRIRIVHPIAAETIITRLTASGETASSRRSPRRGRVEEIFRELTSLAGLLPHDRITVEVALVRVIETRVDDGRGSWRRRGVSIVARRLDSIVATHELRTAHDYLSLLPHDLAEPFSNTDVMQAAALRYRDAQPITSALRKMGLLRIAGVRGRERLYERVEPGA